MHQTELASENYSYGQLQGVQMTVEAGPSLSTVNLYVGQRGAYTPEGGLIPLAEVPASGRRFAAKSQADILDLVRRRLASGLDMEAFIKRVIDHPDQRQSFIQILQATSQKFQSHFYIDPQTALTDAGDDNEGEAVGN